MFRSATTGAAAIALLAASQAQAAEGPCLTQPEVHGMVAYVMPSAMGALIDKCRPALRSDSAMLTRGPQIVSDLQAGQSAAFPMARQAFSKFSGSEGKATADLFMTMPETMLKPIIEQAMSQELVSNVQVKQCPDIDRVFGTLRPLPSANFVDLITQVLSIAARDDRKMPICAD